VIGTKKRVLGSGRLLFDVQTRYLNEVEFRHTHISGPAHTPITRCLDRRITDHETHAEMSINDYSSLPLFPQCTTSCSRPSSNPASLRPLCEFRRVLLELSASFDIKKPKPCYDVPTCYSIGFGDLSDL